MTEVATHPTFKPSDVHVDLPLPFVGTFNHAESEVMAALMVRTMVRFGNEWCAVEPRQIGEATRAEIKEGVPYLKEMLSILRPHPHLLVSEGFAEFLEEKDGFRPAAFTPKGLLALSRWVNLI